MLLFVCSILLVQSAFSSKTLLLKTELVEHLLSEKVCISCLLHTLHRRCSVNFSWAPHFIGVKLVWAPKLVAVGLGISAAQQSVTSFKAQLLVPGLLGVLSTVE